MAHCKVDRASGASVRFGPVLLDAWQRPAEVAQIVLPFADVCCSCTDGINRGLAECSARLLIDPLRNQAYKYSSVAFLQFCKQGNVALMFFMQLGVNVSLCRSDMRPNDAGAKPGHYPVIASLPPANDFT